MMFCHKFFDKERNSLVNFFTKKKKTKMTEKVMEKGPLICTEQIDLILRCYMIYK